jgi:uncharacterized membrane protein
MPTTEDPMTRKMLLATSAAVFVLSNALEVALLEAVTLAVYMRYAAINPKQSPLPLWLRNISDSLVFLLVLHFLALTQIAYVVKYHENDCTDTAKFQSAKHPR